MKKYKDVQLQIICRNFVNWSSTLSALTSSKLTSLLLINGCLKFQSLEKCQNCSGPLGWWIVCGSGLKVEFWLCDTDGVDCVKCSITFDIYIFLIKPRLLVCPCISYASLGHSFVSYLRNNTKTTTRDKLFGKTNDDWDNNAIWHFQ